MPKTPKNTIFYVFPGFLPPRPGGALGGPPGPPISLPWTAVPILPTSGAVGAIRNMSSVSQRTMAVTELQRCFDQLLKEQHSQKAVASPQQTSVNCTGGAPHSVGIRGKIGKIRGPRAPAPQGGKKTEKCEKNLVF